VVIESNMIDAKSGQAGSKKVESVAPNKNLKETVKESAFSLLSTMGR
jgi:hypothetical protein